MAVNKDVMHLILAAKWLVMEQHGDQVGKIRAFENSSWAVWDREIEEYSDARNGRGFWDRKADAKHQSSPTLRRNAVGEIRKALAGSDGQSVRNKK